jgi:hypothetical protein
LGHSDRSTTQHLVSQSDHYLRVKRAAASPFDAMRRGKVEPVEPPKRRRLSLSPCAVRDTSRPRYSDRGRTVGRVLSGITRFGDSGRRSPLRTPCRVQSSGRSAWQRRTLATQAASGQALLAVVFVVAAPPVAGLVAPF